MLVSGPIATSRSSPGAALAASTSLRGAKPAGQRHQMLAETAWAATCSVSAELVPASSSAGQMYTGRVMHTRVSVDSDWPGQQLVRSDAEHAGRLIRVDAQPRPDVCWTEHCQQLGNNLCLLAN